MATVNINHDDFNHLINFAADPDAFRTLHNNNMSRFRQVIIEYYNNIEGHFVFNYLINHQQFDIIDSPIEITNDDINSILGLYPNCWVFV